MRNGIAGHECGTQWNNTNATDVWEGENGIGIESTCSPRLYVNAYNGRLKMSISLKKLITNWLTHPLRIDKPAGEKAQRKS